MAKPDSGRLTVDECARCGHLRGRHGEFNGYESACAMYQCGCCAFDGIDPQYAAERAEINWDALSQDKW